jgi:hypothetical protein
MLMADLAVGMAMLFLVLLPLAYSFKQERKLLLASYQRAVAMSVVDGEMELLVAGEWRSFSNGVHQLPLSAQAATNLPPGTLQLTLSDQQIVLEWLPQERSAGGSVRREFVFK